MDHEFNQKIDHLDNIPEDSASKNESNLTSDFIPDLKPEKSGVVPDNEIINSLRNNYKSQVDLIRRQIGDLEAIRRELGLSQRKICQLLLVDPSAWTRWTRQSKDSAPPHIWRALQWYMMLQEKVPGLTPSYFSIHQSSIYLNESNILQQQSNQRLSELENKLILREAMWTKSHRHLNRKLYILLWLFASLFGFTCWNIQR